MTLKITIGGMHCQGCVQAIQSAISCMEGVRSCTVGVGTVEVTIDEQMATKAELFDAIRGAGPFNVEGFSVLP